MDIDREIPRQDKRALEIAAQEWPGRGGVVRSKFKTVVAGPTGEPIVVLGECRVGFWNQFGEFVALGHGSTWREAFKAAGVTHPSERGLR